MLKINEIDPGADNLRFIAKVIMLLFRSFQQQLVPIAEATMLDAS